MSIGHPNIPRIQDRIQKLQLIIVSNKGFAKIHQAKLAKFQKHIEYQKEKEAKALQSIAESKEFLETAKLTNRLKLLIPWVSSAGCPKVSLES